MLKRHLQGIPLILASQSPRRKRILIENGGLEFEKDFFILPSTFDEKSLDKSAFATPSDFVKENSRCKAKQIFDEKKDSHSDLIVIGSDSIVVYGDKILEKPADEEEAIEMLHMLSDNVHKVVSGVSIYVKRTTAGSSPTEKLISFASETRVIFDKLSKTDIEEYIQTGEPMDKAGAYGIQDLGSAFVKSIEGDYFTVMGLPYHALYVVIRDQIN